jgi:hypothetical protein
MFYTMKVVRWPLMLVALAAIGMIMTSSALAQSNVPVRLAVQTTVDGSTATQIRTADLKASDQVQAQPVRWGWGWGNRWYAPYRAYYPARSYSYYYPAPYYTYYYGTPYSTYYSAPYYTYYPGNYSYGPRVAVRPYARFWW